MEGDLLKRLIVEACALNDRFSDDFVTVEEGFAEE